MMPIANRDLIITCQSMVDEFRACVSSVQITPDRARPGPPAQMNVPSHICQEYLAPAVLHLLDTLKNGPSAQPVQAVLNYLFRLWRIEGGCILVCCDSGNDAEVFSCGSNDHEVEAMKRMARRVKHTMDTWCSVVSDDIYQHTPDTFNTTSPIDYVSIKTCMALQEHSRPYDAHEAQLQKAVGAQLQKELNDNSSD